MQITLKEDYDYNSVCHHIEKQLKMQLHEYGADFNRNDIRAFRDFCEGTSEVDVVKTYVTENFDMEFI